MKLAVASESGKEISGHFGRCSNFIVFDIEGKKAGGGRIVKNPFCDNHAPGAVPEFLISQKVSIVITGGAGPRAVEMLESASIQVFFAHGKVRDAVNQYLEGKLPRAENVCHH